MHAVYKCSSLWGAWSLLAVELSPHSTEKSKFLTEPPLNLPSITPAYMTESL